MAPSSGSGASGGWARLRSTRDLGDFAMRCRLRILGANYAEIQVLDYQAFIPISPEEPGAWQDMAISVRAGRVTATRDGREVGIQVGIDSGRERFGPLSFYIRQDGRLEIRDARFIEIETDSPSVP